MATLRELRALPPRVTDAMEREYLAAFNRCKSRRDALAVRRPLVGSDSASY